MVVLRHQYGHVYVARSSSCVVVLQAMQAQAAAAVPQPAALNAERAAAHGHAAGRPTRPPIARAAAGPPPGAWPRGQAPNQAPPPQAPNQAMTQQQAFRAQLAAGAQGFAAAAAAQAAAQRGGAPPPGAQMGGPALPGAQMGCLAQPQRSASPRWQALQTPGNPVLSGQALQTGNPVLSGQSLQARSGSGPGSPAAMARGLGSLSGMPASTCFSGAGGGSGGVCGAGGGGDAITSAQSSCAPGSTSGLVAQVRVMPCNAHAPVGWFCRMLGPAAFELLMFRALS